MVLHSTPQTPMHQMTQFHQPQKYVEDPNVQYSLNGSITSPVVGNCSIVGSLRRNDVRMIDSPIHQNQHSINDATSMGSSVNVCSSNQQPCSPMISFKPMGNNSSGSNQQMPIAPGILASPLPQPPSNYNKGVFLYISFIEILENKNIKNTLLENPPKYCFFNSSIVSRS